MVCDATSFELNPGPIVAMSYQGSNCSGDYINIEASAGGGFGNTMMHDRYCGQFFSELTVNNMDQKIKDCTAPFEVGIITNDAQDTTMFADANQNSGNFFLALKLADLDMLEFSGVCLTYTQEPCNNGNNGP